MARRRPRGTIAKTGKSKHLAPIIVAVVLAGIPFILGKYIELNTPGPFDSSSYVYSARHILDGAEIGPEEWPSAKLGTLLVNILGVWIFGFSDIGPKIIQGLLQAGALVLMFYSMRKVFGSLAAVITVVIASTYLSAPVIAKHGNVKEQYMIAFMVLGMSCFILRQHDGRWWWGILAGVFVAWAPLFKETGMSAIGAMGLFVIIQPLLRHRSWKQTAADILLLLCGAAISIGPIYIWLIGWNIRMLPPYISIIRVAQVKLEELREMFVSSQVHTDTISEAAEGAKQVDAVKKTEGYIAASRIDYSFSKQAIVTLRYYKVLILPILLATGAIIAGFVKWLGRFFTKQPKTELQNTPDRFVILLAAWWLLDMSFVWISPRPYEQYYLPLTASAAMLAGYLIWAYHDKLRRSISKVKMTLIGILALVCMIVMVWPIFFGLKKSPYSNIEYKQRSRGYAQKLESAAEHRKGRLWPWEIAGRFIRKRSSENDTIYVWGWYPGIYLEARRLSSVPRAFESEMHVRKPRALRLLVKHILDCFEKDTPRFIVDSRHTHFPYDRPPLELWPMVRKGFMGYAKDGFLTLDEKEIARYDAGYAKWLNKHYGIDEEYRYKAMGAFREYIRTNYRIAGTFSEHVVFELNKPPQRRPER